MTAQLLTLLMSDATARDQTFKGFFYQVQQGASRQDIDQWLYEVLDAAPRQRVRLLAHGVDLDRVNWSQLTEYLCACFYASRSRSALPNVPSASAWEDALAPHTHREKAIKFTVPLPVVPLETLLLSLGGKRMVYVGEPDLQRLLARGRVCEEPATLMRGEPSRCHTNAAGIWLKAPAVYSIMTGYALSEDGLWRQHSWLWRKHPRGRQRKLVETTVRRVKYFGFVLEDEEAGAFVAAVGLR